MVSRYSIYRRRLDDHVGCKIINFRYDNKILLDAQQRVFVLDGSRKKCPAHAQFNYIGGWMNGNIAIKEYQNDLIVETLKHQAEQKLRELLPLAKQGDQDAQYQLGDLYSANRPSIPQNTKLAWDWYCKAAKQGHVLATAALIIEITISPFRYSEIRPWDSIEDAINTVSGPLSELAQKHSNEDALRFLGMFNMLGLIGDSDDAAAVRYFHDGAKMGCVKCMAALGLVVLINKEPLINSQFIALEWIKKSWLDYYLPAGVWLGRMYKEKKINTPATPNTSSSFEYFWKAAELGNDEAMMELGNCYLEGLGVPQFEEAAFYWYLKSADHDNAIACYVLGNVFQYFQSIDIPIDQKHTWMEKACELGYPAAMGELGSMLIKGLDIEQEIPRGLELLKCGADEGEPNSLLMLGSMYAEGKYLPQNIKLAADFFMRSARKNVPHGHFRYARVLHVGEGVAQDIPLAKHHYKIALKGGDFSAAIGLGLAERTLTGNAVIALGYLKFGLGKVKKAQPKWIYELADELEAELDDVGLSEAERLCDKINSRFWN